MSSHTEQIKDKIGIVEVVSSYIKLNKSGKNLKACCPFHTEKTPSFFVSPDRETYYCFGCGKGGDVFSFVEEIEGLDFLGALKVLAEKTGVELTSVKPEHKEEKEKLHEVLERTTLFFETQLKKHQAVGEYLKGRGLTGETAKLFRMGFVPDAWRVLHPFLKNKGYTDEDMLKTGLVIKSSNGVYDRFRGRIMFPITDSAGRVVAFSGRVFGETEDNKTTSAKYINSPETVLYNKSRILFGFDKAKLPIRKEDACIVVEGQLDVILSHQVGFLNTVAASGTSLTEQHFTLIGRITKNIVLAFDADEAGLKAMRRNLETALDHGFTVSIAPLPAGADPADVISKDANAWAACIKNAQHVVEFYLDVLCKDTDNRRLMYRNIEAEIIPLLARVQSSVEQAHFVKLIAGRLAIAEEPVWDALKKQKRPVNQHGRIPVVAGMGSANSASFEERRLSSIRKRIQGILLWQESQKTPQIDHNKYKERYKDTIGASLEEDSNHLSSVENDRLILEAEMAHQDSQNISDVLEELFADLRGLVLKVRLIETLDVVKKAEAAGDEKKAEEALSLCHELSQKMSETALTNNKI